MSDHQSTVRNINELLLGVEHLLRDTRMGFWVWKSELFPQGLGGTLFDHDEFRVSGGPFDQLQIEQSPKPCSLSTYIRLVHPDDVEIIQANALRLMQEQLNGYSLTYRIRNRWGDYIRLHVRGSILLSPANHKPMVVYGSAEIVSDNKDAADNPDAANVTLRVHGSATGAAGAGKGDATLIALDAPVRSAATAKRYALSQSQEELARLNEAIAQSSPLMLWQWHAPQAEQGLGSADFQSGVLSGPEHFLPLLGYPASITMQAQEFLRKLVHKDDCIRFMNAVQETFLDDRPLEITYRLVHVSGASFWIHVKGQLKRSSENNLPMQMFGTIDSVRDDQQAAMLLMQEIDLEKNLSSLRLNTLFSVSHDLANPLAAVKFAARLGSSLSPTTQNFTERVKQQFDRILEGADRMSRLIEDSVTLARVSTTRNFKRENIKLAGECRRLIADFCDQHLKAAGDVRLNIPPEVILHNMAHFPLLACLSNLISNAIKYTPDPGKKVEISYSLTDQGFKHRIIIEDEGAGIPERLREELFRPFNRGENVADIKGRGLGLSIVKRSVELLGGELLIDHLQPGTRFTLLLPNQDVKPWELAQSP